MEDTRSFQEENQEPPTVLVTHSVPERLSEVLPTEIESKNDPTREDSSTSMAGCSEGDGYGGIAAPTAHASIAGRCPGKEEEDSNVTSNGNGEPSSVSQINRGEDSKKSARRVSVDEIKSVPEDSSSEDDADVHGKKRRRYNLQQEKWEVMFKKLVHFKNKHGHSSVPNRYPLDRPLGLWVSTQRGTYKRARSLGVNEISPMLLERIHLLDSIGFSWEVRAGPAEGKKRQAPGGIKESLQTPSVPLTILSPQERLAWEIATSLNGGARMPQAIIDQRFRSLRQGHSSGSHPAPSAAQQEILLKHVYQALVEESNKNDFPLPHTSSVTSVGMMPRTKSIAHDAAPADLLRTVHNFQSLDAAPVNPHMQLDDRGSSLDQVIELHRRLEEASLSKELISRLKEFTRVHASVHAPAPAKDESTSTRKPAAPEPAAPKPATHIAIAPRGRAGARNSRK